MKKYNYTQSLRQVFYKPNIIPMYGVLLVIIVTIMPIVPSTTSSSKLILPKAEFSQFEPLEFPTIFINGDGSVYINNLKVTWINTKHYYNPCISV